MKAFFVLACITVFLFIGPLNSLSAQSDCPPKIRDFREGGLKIVSMKLPRKGDFKYPQISAPKTPQQRKFNAEVLRIVRKDLSANAGEGYGFSAPYATSEFVSVQLISSVCGASCHVGITAINFDLQTGKLIKSLSEIFKPESNYLKTIASYSVGELNRCHSDELVLDEDLFKEGTEPTAKNYESWGLTSDGLQINFPEYQIASGAFPDTHVVIPYSHLQGMLRQDIESRLQAVAKNTTRPSASPAPRGMTAEEDFYYKIAVYGYAKTDPYGKVYDNVYAYATTFDETNYKRAMADEFERARYRARILAKIEEGVKKVDFTRRFTSVWGYWDVELGEYSFESNSFPVIGIPTGTFSVNENQFIWALPMSEAAANTFVKSRSMVSYPGSVNRNVVLRVTYSIVNEKTRSHHSFFRFVYSVEVFGDKSLTSKLGDIRRADSSPRTPEEWRSAYVSSQTPTKEIGVYRYMPYNEGDGKIHNPLKPELKVTGTITLTDVGITMSQGRRLEIKFYDWHHFLSRYNKSFERWEAGRGSFHVGFAEPIGFETQQERDRFFADLASALQEWKTKYEAFQFAAGNLTIKWACTSGPNDVPCTDSTPTAEKPVWQTESYKVTVESLEKNANTYTATLVFENLTDKSLAVGWQEKSGLLPDALGPYLIDENGEKYFANGTDSGNIISDSMKWLWKTHKGIPAKTKLTSRFLFSGSGNGMVFRLKAKTNDLPRLHVTIEGLKLTTATK